MLLEAKITLIGLILGVFEHVMDEKAIKFNSKRLQLRNVNNPSDLTKLKSSVILNRKSGFKNMVPVRINVGIVIRLAFVKESIESEKWTGQKQSDTFERLFLKREFPGTFYIICELYFRVDRLRDTSKERLAAGTRSHYAEEEVVDSGNTILEVSSEWVTFFNKFWETVGHQY
ncbi:hypothetical protein TNCV_153571 [Trichonephila clavipes]|nr:hypothetical protein TNCV_153571 [Trichonephila clavipes]